MIPNNDKLRWLALEAQKYNKAFIAMDDDGLWYGYEKRPEFRAGNWYNGGDFVCLTPVPDSASEQIFEVTKLLTDEQL